MYYVYYVWINAVVNTCGMAMDPRVASYLDAVPRHMPPTVSGDSTALVIVETRPLPHLPQVIASAVRTHPGWHLYVYAPPAVHDFLDRGGSLVGGEYTKVTLEPKPMTTAHYSKLLLSRQFWEVVREEHILVFQADCVVVRPTPPEFMRYDYVGALCGLLLPSRFVMNGGLSLRRRSAMVRAILLMTDDEAREPEDIAFMLTMRRNAPAFTLPTMEECDRFAIESQGDPRTAVGVHGTDKRYAPPALLEELFDSLSRSGGTAASAAGVVRCNGAS